MTYLQRKKLAFMSIVNSIKGFLRTVSGVPPLTLYNCVDTKSVINYIIRGRSVQNGTPTLETPVEVESVGEYDEETGKYKIPIKVNESKTIDIYLDEPLRKINEYTDYIDFENKKLIRHIYHEKITTIREMPSISGTYRIFLSNISNRPINTSAGSQVWSAMSNKFKKAENGYYQGLTSKSGVISTYLTGSNANTVAYTFNDSTINTVAKAKAAIGTGFDVYYPLYTPIKTDIDLPVLPTMRGTTIYSIDTAIQPSNMEVSYYSTSKE